MGHLNHHKALRDLRARLDQMPAGFPESPEALEILRLLFSPEEAELVARMPFKPLFAREIARRVGRDEASVATTLDRLSGKGLIFDIRFPGEQRSRFCVAPPVVGFFEFSMMRRRSDLDQGALARAYEEFSVDGRSFVEGVFSGETQLGRALVHEDALKPDDLSHLLTYERASEVVREASACAVSLCYCRHKAEHLGHPCVRAPLENCLSLNLGAEMVLRQGNGRPVSRGEALEILERARELSLVHIADNVQKNVSYICQCCGCCCGQLQAISRHGLLSAVRTSAFIARIDAARCTGCGRCARLCPVQAIQIHALPQHVQRKARMYSQVDEKICLGCGVCKPACTKTAALSMVRRAERVLTPAGTLERILSMALERDRLQHVLFDEQEGMHALLLNRLVGAILGMPPVKRALLGEKLKSRFVGFLARQGRRMAEGMEV